MGWQIRRGRKYFYRSVRNSDGRVRSIYVGAGEVGEQAAREDAERRASKRAERRARRRPAVAETPSAPPVFSSPEQINSLLRLTYSAAVAQLEAALVVGGDVAAFVESLNVDGVTRSLLRYKLMAARGLAQV